MGLLPKPLTNEQLAEIRRKANPVAATFKPTAESIAYESGVKALAPVVERIEALEATVKDLADRVEKLLALGAPDVGAIAGSSTGQVVSPAKPNQTT